MYSTDESVTFGHSPHSREIKQTAVRAPRTRWAVGAASVTPYIRADSTVVIILMLAGGGERGGTKQRTMRKHLSIVVCASILFSFALVNAPAPLAA